MTVIRLLQIVVPGEPCGKGRPRFCVTRGFGKRPIARAYTPKKTENAQATIKAIWAQAYPGFTPLARAVEMTIIAYMGIPASSSAKRKAAMLSQNERPTKKPDASNILKLAEDALNGLAYLDDKQVVDVRVRKFYSDRPRLQIDIIESNSLGSREYLKEAHKA